MATSNNGHGPLYIGFSASNGFFGKLLRKTILTFTGGKANHAFLIYLDSELGWITLGANQNGVTFIPLAQFERTRTILALYGLKDPSVNLWDGLAKLKGDIGKSYNFSGLIGMAGVEIARRWFGDKKATNLLNDSSDLFCSEFDSDVIRADGVPVLGTTPADTISPAQLMAALATDPAFVAIPLSVLTTGAK